MAKLSKAERDRARRRAVQAALVGYRNRDRIGYSQGANRWSGIEMQRDASKGQYPPVADCSAFATWCLWNGLYLGYRRADVVNGLAWRYGFTGTQIEHGRRVAPGDLGRADLVFYASSGTKPTHVAICVGAQRDTRPMVVSHGQASGPLYLPWNYRRVVATRRYIYEGV